MKKDETLCEKVKKLFNVKDSIKFKGIMMITSVSYESKSDRDDACKDLFDRLCGAVDKSSVIGKNEHLLVGLTNQFDESGDELAIWGIVHYSPEVAKRKFTNIYGSQSVYVK